MQISQKQKCFKMPLRNVPQRFGIHLLEQDYFMETSWNDMGQNWEISLFNESKEPVITDIPLVSGADLLRQHKHLLPAIMVCYTQGDSNAVPTFENLGKDSNLYFVVSI